MKNYDTFSTTADVGIHIRGKGYAQLYENALNGINLLLFGTDKSEIKNTNGKCKTIPFKYNGDSCENVLVNFLSELAYMVFTCERQPVSVSICSAGDTFLDADVITVPITRSPEVEIKSVTYHNLKVVETGGLLTASVIFDI